MRDFIISELLNLNVINKDKLIEYVDFCINNCQKTRTKFITAHHHILPKAKTLPFKKYSNLRECPWNGVHLSHKDHYTAHYMLAIAVDEVAISRPFIAMNYQDVKKAKLNLEDLIGAEEYQIILKRHLKSFSKLMVETMPNLMNDIYAKRDKAYRTNKSINSAITMKKEGIYERNAKNHRIHQNEIMESGLTRAQETGKKVSATRLEKFKTGEIAKNIGSKNSMAAKINIFNSNNELMFECHGDFEKVCAKNNLPRSALKFSYQNDNRGFQKTKGMTKEFFEKNIQFVGWYAVKI